jgi:hypothetical protein
VRCCSSQVKVRWNCSLAQGIVAEGKWPAQRWGLGNKQPLHDHGGRGSKVFEGRRVIRGNRAGGGGGGTDWWCLCSATAPLVSRLACGSWWRARWWWGQIILSRSQLVVCPRKPHPKYHVASAEATKIQAARIQIFGAKRAAVKSRPRAAVKSQPRAAAVWAPLGLLDPRIPRTILG